MNPEFQERRQRQTRCRECGSSDVWRIGDEPENAFAAIIHRGKKPFQCRKCLHRFYQFARRDIDARTPVQQAARKRTLISWSLASTAVVVTLSLAVLHWGTVPADFIHSHASPAVQGSLTNEDIISLKKAGLGDGVITQKIKSVPGTYRLDTPDLIRLRREGLSDGVITAMLAAMDR